MVARCIHAALRCHGGVEMALHPVWPRGLQSSETRRDTMSSAPLEVTYMDTGRILHSAHVYSHAGEA